MVEDNSNTIIPNPPSLLNQRVISLQRATYSLSFVFSVVIHYAVLNVVAQETAGNCLFFL